jgi:hypothetical protein
MPFCNFCSVRGVAFKILALFSLACSLGACSLLSSKDGVDGVSARGLSPQEWAALSKPGPSHRLLETFVGEWDVQLTFWSDPRSKSDSSSGTSKISWILGERFLQEHFSGKIGGEDYTGLGMIGYDNGSRTFKTVWADSMNTALTVSSGRYYPDTNSFLLESQVYDPLVSGVKTIQSKFQINSPDSYTFSMTDTSPEGRQFTSFEMRYTRRR